MRSSVAKMKFLIIPVFICLLWAHAAFADCSVSNFELSPISSKVQSGHIIFKGEVKNNCKEAAALGIHATAYGEDGSVIDSGDFLPSGNQNIQPGATQSFNLFLNIDRKVGKLTVVPASVRKW